MEDVITFLNKILVNNNRPWFQENKNLYLKAQDQINKIIDIINPTPKTTDVLMRLDLPSDVDIAMEL